MTLPASSTTTVSAWAIELSRWATRTTVILRAARMVEMAWLTCDSAFESRAEVASSSLGDEKGSNVSGLSEERRG